MYVSVLTVTRIGNIGRLVYSLALAITDKLYSIKAIKASSISGLELATTVFLCPEARR